jgi:hypothetical protein
MLGAMSAALFAPFKHDPMRDQPLDEIVRQSPELCAKEGHGRIFFNSRRSNAEQHLVL